MATHLGPRPLRIRLLVSKFRVVGSDRSGQFGNPRPFEVTQIGQQLLEKLSSLRASNRSLHRPQSVTALPGEAASSKPSLANRSSPEAGHLQSQQFFSQVPTGFDPKDATAAAVKKPLTGLRLPQQGSAVNLSRCDSKSRNQAEALLEKIKSKRAARSTLNDVAPPQNLEPALKPISSPEQLAEVRLGSPSPAAETSCVDPSQPGRSARASPTQSHTVLEGTKPSNNPKPMRIRSRDTKISKDQQKLLDREDSWLPPEPGRRGPVANVPIAVLQEITQRVERQKAKGSANEVLEASEQALENMQASVQISEPDGHDDTESELFVESADWPPSSPIPAPRELPPDSSMELADNSDNEHGMRPPQMKDTSADDHANQVDVDSSPTTPKHFGASLTQPEGVPANEHMSTPTRSNFQPANRKTQSPGPAHRSVTSEDTPRLALGSKNRSTVVTETDSVDNDSDLETSVPLNLSEEPVSTTDISSTQEIPATAYEQGEPVLQVKRSPYGAEPTRGGHSQAHRPSMPSESYTSPSKRRRIDYQSTPLGIDSEAADHDAQAMRSPRMSCGANSQTLGNLTPAQVSGIEETVLVNAPPQEAGQTPRFASRTGSVTPSPANMPSQVPGDPNDGRPELRHKVQSPSMSPNVTKRRKMHKSPFPFSFTQEEYPKEDPSFTARRHREAFFASRKNSRTVSHTSPNEVAPAKPRSSKNSEIEPLSPARHADRIDDEHRNAQEVQFALEHRSSAPSSSQISPSNQTRQQLGANEGSLGLEEGFLRRQSHEISTPPRVSATSGPLAPVSNQDTAPRTTSQAPVVANIEKPHLLLSQTVPANLQSVSVKLETLSSTEVSQKTSHSGQAQSLPELMTPALSVSDLPASGTPPVKLAAATANPESAAQPDVFLRFKAAYPDYLGTKEHFSGMCKRIHQLSQADRMEHKSLWDDFIVRHKTDYPQYCQRCMDNGEDPKPYERFYRDEIDEPEYTKRIVLPASLGKVVSADYPTVPTQGSVSVKVESPHARLGAGQPSLGKGSHGSVAIPVRLPSHDTLATEVQQERRSATVEAKGPSWTSKSPVRLSVLESETIVDLTSDGDSSALEPQSPGLPSKGNVHYSTSKMRRPNEQTIVRDTPRAFFRRDETRRVGVLEQRSKQRVAPGPSAATPSRTPEATGVRHKDGTDNRVINLETAEAQPTEPLRSSQRGIFQQTKPKAARLSRKNGQASAGSATDGKTRSTQQAAEVDRWWEDENTPFREYKRLYESITPGKGNAWAEKKAEVGSKGKQMVTRRSASPEIDVMSWRL